MRPGFPDRARESRGSPRLIKIWADICRARRHEKIARVQIKKRMLCAGLCDSKDNSSRFELSKSCREGERLILVNFGGFPLCLF